MSVNRFEKVTKIVVLVAFIFSQTAMFAGEPIKLGYYDHDGMSHQKIVKFSDIKFHEKMIKKYQKRFDAAKRRYDKLMAAKAKNGGKWSFWGRLVNPGRVNQTINSMATNQTEITARQNMIKIIKATGITQGFVMANMPKAFKLHRCAIQIMVGKKQVARYKFNEAALVLSYVGPNGELDMTNPPTISWTKDNLGNNLAILSFPAGTPHKAFANDEGDTKLITLENAGATVTVKASFHAEASDGHGSTGGSDTGNAGTGNGGNTGTGNAGNAGTGNAGPGGSGGGL